MTTIANNRRKASQSINTFKTKETSATTGSDVRKQIVLTPALEKRLEIFKTTNGLTERDVYLVYRAKPQSHLGKACVETDTCPYLIVEEIGALTGNDNHFLLPVYVIQNNEKWIQSMPNFEKWLYSSCRYPKISTDNKSIEPNRNTSGLEFKNCSKLDEFELYAASFIATLGEYFKTGQNKYAENCWKVMSTLNYLLSKQNDTNTESKIDSLLANKDKLKTLISNRDKSEFDAIQYKNFVNGINCSEYYWIMYNLMIESPESVHKSNLMNMDLLLMGLLTQFDAKLNKEANIGGSYDGIQDIILRMILERSMKHIKKLNCNEFVKLDDLVEFLHTRAGVSVQNSLRYWSFLTGVIKIIINENLSLNNFVSRLHILRNQIYTIKGILPFCLMISPYCDKYLSNESIAEYILNVSQHVDKKFVVLNTAMLVTKADTYPTLYALINKNIERIKSLQKR